jgi:aspartyl-tRNA(Asn)/glutamyl-tRNA(Gln) amidotransferase subunit C
MVLIETSDTRNQAPFPMSITPETVNHVAKLARLELTAEEASRFAKELGSILTLVDQLNEVDLSGIEVEMSADTPSVLRIDQGIREFTREELMANAPDEEDGCFRVPKILGENAG